ncbi:MAG: hypothetical protein V4610_01745 [Pseudomonadota bacterium]
MTVYGAPLKVTTGHKGFDGVSNDGVTVAVVELVTLTVSLSVQLRVRLLFTTTPPWNTKVPDAGENDCALAGTAPASANAVAQIAETSFISALLFQFFLSLDVEQILIRRSRPTHQYYQKKGAVSFDVMLSGSGEVGR